LIDWSVRADDIFSICAGPERGLRTKLRERVKQDKGERAYCGDLMKKNEEVGRLSFASGDFSSNTY
jgi:hypothetical protein